MLGDDDAGAGGRARMRIARADAHVHHGGVGAERVEGLGHLEDRPGETRQRRQYADSHAAGEGGEREVQDADLEAEANVRLLERRIARAPEHALRRVEVREPALAGGRRVLESREVAPAVGLAVAADRRDRLAAIAEDRAHRRDAGRRAMAGRDADVDRRRPRGASAQARPRWPSRSRGGRRRR